MNAMTQIVQIISSPVVAKIDGLDHDSKTALSEAMSFIVEGHEHMSAGNWDGRSTLYDWATGKFPAGFVPTAVAVLQQRGLQVQHLRHPLPTPLGPLPQQGASLVDNFPADPDRDYQFKTVRTLEKHGSMIARIATGGGKSRIAAMCIKRIGRLAAFVTTRKVLLFQMGEALKRAGFKVAYVGDGMWEFPTTHAQVMPDVVLAMIPTLADRLRPFEPDPLKMSAVETQVAHDRWEKKNAECLALCDATELLIAEEAHEAGGNSYFEVCKAMKKAHYRLALTATPLMRDGESNMRLVAMFGPVRIEVSEKQLIDAGILATPIFKFVKTPVPPTLRRGTAWQKAEEIGIVNNVDRNKLACAEVIRAARFGLSSLVLIKRKTHGKIVHDMLQRFGLRGTYIFGESSTEKRQDALDKLSSGFYDYIIGSTILDVGVDVPSIGLLVLLGGGKAEVTLRQRIGRGLRQKKGVPNFAFIVDFEDACNKHLIKHAKQRRAIIEDTDGFREGILRGKADFDYFARGFRPPVKDAA